MSNDRPICELFMAIAELHGRDKLPPLNRLSGCWERQIGRWWIAVNGHDQPVKCSKGAAVGAFECYVEYNGWPAGIFNPYGGVLAAGSCANEDVFLAAVRAEPGRSEVPA